jgi:hypothetical protein
VQSLPEGGCNRYQSTFYKPLVSSNATIIIALGKRADNNEMFENDNPNDRQQLIEKLQAKGLPASEFDSGSGIHHVVVPLLQLSERGLEIHAQDNELRLELERALEFNPYYPHLFIATNNLRTSFEIGLMGEDAYGEVISTYDWELIPDVKLAAAIFEGFWNKRDEWLKKWMAGALNGPQAEQQEKSYKHLIAVLNKLGYYPKSREDAKRIAQALLDQGWEE